MKIAFEDIQSFTDLAKIIFAKDQEITDLKKEVDLLLREVSRQEELVKASKIRLSKSEQEFQALYEEYHDYRKKATAENSD